MGWPGADVEQSDLVERRGLVKVVQESGGPVGELAVALFSAGREAVHDLQIVAAIGLPRLDHAATGFQQRGYPHGEFIDRRLQITVLVGEYLALFGEFDLSVDRSRWLREDRFVSGAASPTDGATTAVEQSVGDAPFPQQVGDLFLGVVQLPGGGDDAAILAGVGVAEHHLLEISRLFQ